MVCQFVVIDMMLIAKIGPCTGCWPKGVRTVSVCPQGKDVVLSECMNDVTSALTPGHLLV